VSVIGGPRGGIQVYDADGKYLRNVPNAPNDFHGFVIHQEADGEFIYGTRLGGQSILKMTLDGKILLNVPADMFPDELKNERNGKKFLRLTAVDVAPDGRIFAVDGYSTDIIHVFDQKGKYLNSFGGKKAPYKFKTLHKIAIDTRFDAPRIIGCDRENRRVVHLSLDGELLGIAENLKRPAAAVIQGNLAIVAEIEGRVSFLDKELKTVRTLGENSVKEHTATNQVPPEKWIPGELMAPHGLDFAPDGDLLVTEYSRFGRVVRYARQE
jgi:WD40 repeat protein